MTEITLRLPIYIFMTTVYSFSQQQNSTKTIPLPKASKSLIYLTENFITQLLIFFFVWDGNKLVS